MLGWGGVGNGECGGDEDGGGWNGIGNGECGGKEEGGGGDFHRGELGLGLELDRRLAVPGKKLLNLMKKTFSKDDVL